MLKDIVIIGAGGVGRETALIIEDINNVNKEWNLIGFVDDNDDIQNTKINDYDVVGKLDYLLNYLRARKANSVEIVSLLTKPSRRKVDIDVKYVGFESPDEFLVGYGLDYAQKYRNLPYMGVVEFEEENSWTGNSGEE